MKENELISRFENIIVWRNNGSRASHKPLLLLIAIRYAIFDNKQLISYLEIEDELTELLMKYGPQRKTYHTEYPFWRLKNDGIWMVENSEKVTENKSGDVGSSDLIDKNIRAGFNAEIYNGLLNSKPNYIRSIVQFILDEHFPYSLHNELLEDIGLDLRYEKESLKRKRNPEFRLKILNTYDFKCAVCGYDLRFYNKSLALEAAHIKWHNAGGPDIEENGVALCTLHHKLFDFGAMAIDKDLKLLISDKLQGSHHNLDPLLSLHQELINAPLTPSHYPKQEFIEWHHEEVFKKRIKKSK